MPSTFLHLFSTQPVLWGSFLLLLAGCQDPAIPNTLSLLNATKRTLEEAKKLGAETLAPEPLSLAESELRISEAELHIQQQKVFWTRDFSVAFRLARLAHLDAEKALSQTAEGKEIGTSDIPARPPDKPSAQDDVL